MILISVISGLFCTIGYSKTDDIATNQYKSDTQDLRINIKIIQNHEQSKSSLKTNNINDESNKTDPHIEKENIVFYFL